jgi:hypothetical protein
MGYYGFHAWTNDGTRHAPECVAVVIHDRAPQLVLFFLPRAAKAFKPSLPSRDTTACFKSRMNLLRQVGVSCGGLRAKCVVSIGSSTVEMSGLTEAS